MIATGANLDKAMWLAVELETIAKQYYHSLPIGGPVVLPDSAIDETRKSFGSYGLQDEKPKAKAKAKAKARAQSLSGRARQRGASRQAGMTGGRLLPR